MLRKVLRSVSGFCCVTILAVAMMAPSSDARPVSREPIEVQQPDGTSLVLRAVGDEAISWFEDQNGYTILLVGETYEYAARGADGALTPTGIAAGSVDPKTVGLTPHILPTYEVIRAARAKFKIHPKTASTGTLKMLVLPIRFTNHVSRKLPTKADWEALFNTGQRSLKNFYLDCSYNKLTLEAVVTDWIDVSKTEAQAKADLEPVLLEALQTVDANGFNFKQCDNDGSGSVQIMTFLHSGYDGAITQKDEDGTPYTQRIHSHAYSISTFTAKDGTKITDYCINPALDGVKGSNQPPINTPAHEIGHVLGLPDLYDTTKASNGVGYWCIMCESDGTKGDHVPLFSAWCRVRLGWVVPSIATADGLFQSKAAVGNASVIKIQNGYPKGEYLLIENRQKSKWESKFPGDTGGLFIWHVDEKVGSVEDNNVNDFVAPDPANGDFSKHYRVALIQADGLYHLEQKDGESNRDDLFRGDTDGRTSVGPNTQPHTKGYQGGTLKNSNVRVSQISACSATMSFKITMNNTPRVSLLPNVGTGAATSGNQKQTPPLAVYSSLWNDGITEAAKSAAHADIIPNDFSDELLDNETEGPMTVDPNDPTQFSTGDDPNIYGTRDNDPNNPELVDMHAFGGVPEFPNSIDDIDGDGEDDDAKYGCNYGATATGDANQLPAAYRGNGRRYVIPFAVSDDEITDPNGLRYLVTSDNASVIDRSDVQIVAATPDLLAEAQTAGLMIPEGANCVLIITPRGTGTAKLTLTVGDGTTRVDQTFTLVVYADRNGDGTPDHAGPGGFFDLFDWDGDRLPELLDGCPFWTSICGVGMSTSVPMIFVGLMMTWGTRRITHTRRRK